MRTAARIRQIRLERLVSLEEVETKTGLAQSLIARLENGQEVPTLEMLDTLADGLGVPLHRFFYDGTGPPWTPRLMPRASWEKLAEERPHRAAPVRLAKARCLVLAVSHTLSGLPTRIARGLAAARMRP
jgi:transcriptional regulator with XRE-family HTH domain